MVLPMPVMAAVVRVNRLCVSLIAIDDNLIVGHLPWVNGVATQSADIAHFTLGAGLFRKKAAVIGLCQ